jgi:hypothetical protein
LHQGSGGARLVGSLCERAAKIGLAGFGLAKLYTGGAETV